MIILTLGNENSVSEWGWGVSKCPCNRVVRYSYIPTPDLGGFEVESRYHIRIEYSRICYQRPSYMLTGSGPWERLTAHNKLGGGFFTFQVRQHILRVRGNFQLPDYQNSELFILYKMRNDP